MSSKTENPALDIDLNETIAEGIYSNLAIISHSTSEFVVDFVQLMPGMPKAKVRSRIIMTPDNAKRLMMSLVDNVQKFESTFGEIELEQAPSFPPMMGFGGGEA